MTTRHLTRKALIAAATGLRSRFASHLDVCSDCRKSVEMLAAFPVAGRLPLPSPPAAWVALAKSIPQRPSGKPFLERLMATLTFDSWLSPVPSGVRGQGIAGERRACFKADSWIVDLRAEKRKDHWSMVAQLAGEPQTDTELMIGKRTFRSDSQGIFQWTSLKPPLKMTIRIGDKLIVLPELPWKYRKPR